MYRNSLIVKKTLTETNDATEQNNKTEAFFVNTMLIETIVRLVVAVAVVLIVIILISFNLYRKKYFKNLRS